MAEENPQDPKPDPPEEETEETTTEQTDPEALKQEVQKWKSLSRKHERSAKENKAAADRLKAAEESEKTEVERLTSRATEAETKATDAERRALRLEVALDKAPDGMPIGQIRKLANRLVGENREELEADAAELFADFAPDKGTNGDKPKEKLRPGADNPDKGPEVSGSALLEAMPRGR